MRYSGAEIVVKSLERQGIKIIAGIPGGANLPIYNALYKSSIRHILARHEQGAGFIAHGIARSTGKAAVCLATSGPGATNLITAIADAKLDSVPLIAITGQVPRAMIGTDAFQEVDTYGMTLNLTKHSFLVMDPEQLIHIIPKAFEIAETGRPGPVVIDIPKDIQIAEVNVDVWPDRLNDAHTAIDTDRLKKIAHTINTSHRPLIYAGGGIVHSGASDVLFALAKKNSIPVALTLMGLGAFPHDDSLYLGMLGMHGAQATNYSLYEADVLLAFGARFDDRAIGKAQEFCPYARIVHIDVDQAEINKIKRSAISLNGDVRRVLEALLPLIDENRRPEWMSRIREIKSEYPCPIGQTGEDPLVPINLITQISSIVGPDAIITTDVGQHQMWVAQYYLFMQPRTLLTSGGLGTMGFGLPAAIGAALANPEKKVVCISGDGSLQMNIQELATLAELNLNIKIVVMNNQHLGLVRQQQELFFDNNYIASKFTRRLDFAAIAREFGIRGVNLADTIHPEEIIRRVFGEKGTYIIDVPIHEAENVYPMVPPGAANREMITG